ncbi:MAG: hypothetical protein ACK4WF_09830, partial [Candidatus Brocadiales bacterium]
MSESYIQIKETLKAVKKELLWVRLAEGLALIIAVSLLIFLLGIGLSGVLANLPWGREAYLLLWVAVLVYTSYR